MSTGWGSDRTAGPASAPQKTSPHQLPQEQREDEEEEEEGGEQWHQIQPIEELMYLNMTIYYLWI